MDRECATLSQKNQLKAPATARPQGVAPCRIRENRRLTGLIAGPSGTHHRQQLLPGLTNPNHLSEVGEEQGITHQRCGTIERECSPRAVVTFGNGEDLPDTERNKYRDLCQIQGERNLATRTGGTKRCFSSLHSRKIPPAGQRNQPKPFTATFNLDIHIQENRTFRSRIAYCKHRKVTFA